MLVPESWLRSFCNPPISGQALADRLTMAGIEVEAYEPYGPQFSGVVVGEVLSVEKHPNAEKLTVCAVSTGNEMVRVVCGAPNVRAGMKAPLAKVGARLPEMEIKAAALRGVESKGMLASARELGLSSDHSGLLELPQDAKPGADVRTVLGLDERVMTLKLTPSGADCLSILGVAREVSALTGVRLEAPEIERIPAKTSAKHPVRISAPEGCGRFAGRVIRNVDAKAPTPPWMKERLERAGQRSISALVDVTNYVMLELGRPLHVYDLDELKGAIDVRWGRKGEKVLLLNEQTVDVDDSVLCIADESGVIGLAGIMGGESTKADEVTRNIFLESAFFHPAAVAGRARRYNFTSDASHRFERGVDFANNVDGIERATRLIVDICGGEPGPTEDLVARLPERKPVPMRIARAQKVIGVAVAQDEMAAVFDKLGLPFEREKDRFIVKPPSFRFDLEIEEDLIEEVARIHGFERIAAHPPLAPARMLPEPERRRSPHALRERLAGAAHPGVRGRTRVLSRPPRRGRSALSARRRPAVAHRRGGLRPGPRAAMGGRGAHGRLLRRQGRPRSPVGAARAPVRARRASGAAPGALGQSARGRQACRLDRRAASEVAAQVRVAAAADRLRSESGCIDAGSAATAGSAFAAPHRGARHRDGVRRRDFRPERSGHNSRPETADRAFGAVLQPLSRSGPTCRDKIPCFSGSYARYCTDPHRCGGRRCPRCAGSAPGPEILR